jgi:ATP-dependent DNA helicase RecG
LNGYSAEGEEERVKYIETIGTGLTDLLKECKAKGLKKPLLEEVSGRFRIVIWRPKAVANRGANRGANLLDALPAEQRRICEELLTNPRISSRVLAKVLGIRRNTVLKQFEALKTKGILIRKGGTRGFWDVKETNH